MSLALSTVISALRVDLPYPVQCRLRVAGQHTVVVASSCASYGGVRAARAEDTCNSAGVPNTTSILRLLPNSVRRCQV